MFNKPIVLIVGAGASFDKYGLPLGKDLAAQIATDTDFYWDHSNQMRPTRGSPDLFEQVLWRKFYNTDRQALNRYTEAAQRLSGAIGSTASIDDALYQLSEYPESVEIGKICIVRSILGAESGSAIRIDPQIGQMGRDAGRDGWIEQIFSMAITNLKLSEIPFAFRRITFINFNYDRCIEHYIFWSLIRLGIPQETAGQVVSELNIVRPYGGLGSIVQGSKGYLQFGSSPQLDFFSLLPRIRTFTESDLLHDKEHLAKVLMEAALVVFLGFGFHPQNLQLLSLSTHQQLRHLRVLATVKGLHPANLPELKYSISHALRTDHGAIDFQQMGAAEFLTELRMKINLLLG